MFKIWHGIFAIYRLVTFIAFTVAVWKLAQYIHSVVSPQTGGAVEASISDAAAKLEKAVGELKAHATKKAAPAKAT